MAMSHDERVAELEALLFVLTGISSAVSEVGLLRGVGCSRRCADQGVSNMAKQEAKAMSLEDELVVMVGIRNRSVGMDLKRANYRLAQLQNAIAVADMRKTVPVLKAHLSLEEYLDEEFRIMGVTPHITHIKLPQESYYIAVTVASRYHVPYPDQVRWLGRVFAEAPRAKMKSNLGTFILNAYAEGGFGVALCHYLDSFNRQRGRIIAKGRLLKVLRKEGLKR